MQWGGTRLSSIFRLNLVRLSLRNFAPPHPNFAKVVRNFLLLAARRPCRWRYPRRQQWWAAARDRGPGAGSRGRGLCAQGAEASGERCSAALFCVVTRCSPTILLPSVISSSQLLSPKKGREVLAAPAPSDEFREISSRAARAQISGKNLRKIRTGLKLPTKVVHLARQGYG